MTGCAAVSYTPLDSTVPAIAGVVHGGEIPIQGAAITLYTTSSTSYGGAATVIGTATTDVNGSFSISPSVSTSNCPAGQQAYITSTGGYQTGNSSLTNTSILLMAALGNCANIGPNSGVTINEVTTVAAAYALSGFITTTSTGSGSNLVWAANVGGPVTGLSHAFMNAAALANYVNGMPNSTVSVSSGGTTATGNVPFVEINTLADIMSACVDSATGSTNCTKLFGFTPSISQVTPANTLQAFVNLARNPYPSAAAVASSGLISLVAASGTPFVNYLSAPPSDWSLSIVYSGGGIQPGYWLALDANDTAYVELSTITTSTPLLFGISAYGNTVPAFANNPGTSTSNQRGIAPDALGNIWVSDNSTHAYRFSTSTGSLSSTYTSGSSSAFPLAVDAKNNLWIGHVLSTGVNAEEVANNSGSWATTGATLTASMPGGLYGITVDASQNIWGACYYAGTGGVSTDACMIPNKGTVSVPSYSSTTTATPLTATLSGSASKPYAVSMDASGNAWHTILGSNSATTTGILEVVPSSLLSATSITPGSFLFNTTAGSNTATSGNEIGVQSAEESAIDGAGTMFMGDVIGHPYGLHAYSTTTGYVLSPTNGFASCYLATSATTSCASTSASFPTYDARGIAIDSTGSVWLNNSTLATTGTVTQLIGIAAPTNPLLSAGKPGLSPGATAVTPLP